MTDDSRARFEREALPHLKAVYNLARRLTRREDEARDLTQETFLRCLSEVRKLRRRNQLQSLAVDCCVLAVRQRLSSPTPRATVERHRHRRYRRHRQVRLNPRGGLELQDLLDSRLSPSDRARVQGHLDACARCRGELDALTRGRDLARALTATDLPAGLAEAIQTYDAYRAGQRPLALTTSDTALLEQFFSRQLPFRIRVFDLAMMRYRLIGGRTDHLGGHQTALFVYTGPDDRRFPCQMYRGNVTELPKPTQRRTHNGISFLIYSRAAHTVVFWPEADVLCVVVSDMPSEDTIALAVAKAMKS